MEEVRKMGVEDVAIIEIRAQAWVNVFEERQQEKQIVIAAEVRWK